MIATAKAERDKVVNWLALALVVDNGVDPDYAMQLGGILPDDAVIPMRGIYSQATIDAMGELKADGLSFKAIGDMYQISSHAVYRLLKKRGDVD